MADMARAALIAALAISVAGPVQSTLPAPGGLMLRAGNAGKLAIVNTSAEPVTISSELAVERRELRSWETVPTRMLAIAVCPDGRLPLPETLTVPAASTREIIAWTGDSCDKQCAQTCSFNLYAGAGTYRFVAIRLPGGERVISNAFTMPPRSRPR